MIKKKHPSFRVPNLNAKSRKRVQDRWRAQQGIDNKKRIKRAGYGAMPNIGYKNSVKVRYARPDGTFGILINNEKELYNLVNMKNVSIILSHSLSNRKRVILENIAKDKGLRVVNKVKK